MKQSDQSRLWQLYQQIWFKCDPKITVFESFAIITACNPGSMEQDFQSNQIEQQKLFEDLTRLKLTFCQLDAGDEQFRYFEPSYAVQCSLKQAMDLCRRYQQNALYWVLNDRLWLIPVNMLKQVTTEIGSFSERIVVN